MGGGKVAVVGGSIAGCAMALAASRGGAEQVTVFERAGGELRDRGVGIGVHGDRFAELEAAGYMTDAMPWAPLSRRLWTVRDGATDLGRNMASQPFPFRAYNWGSLWSELRRRVPDGTDFRAEAHVAQVATDADRATVRLADGSEEHFDLVIGADGYRSVVRQAMFPELAPAYAGYLGWRGTSEAPADLPEGGDEEARVVVFPGGHCMMYLIPDRKEGHRMNWVLYTRPPAESGLDEELRSPTSLPPGKVAAELTASLRDLVAEHFPPYWADCVLRSPEERTFIQPIYDLSVPHYARGRLLLAGDAATVARPHIGAGSVKALQDAAALERVWRSGGSWQEILTAYDEGRSVVGGQMVGLARRMGEAQVVRTPDWSTMREPEFHAWWEEQNRGSAPGGSLGGQALRPD
ncbi:FAD-dependent monooxygenase [Streptomyces albidus (ex Kaewkla and Franco 2022)]|uniref:FAD-dependent monooxygenase n=1 Tax=Streptomyces albidus (ex Kaewkla and Franco 2022) TaxID=722709 RepID=UPI0015EFB2EB|nr:FAD-dependent monooxygenase [Streptomyces albidus (ex Kaewkla and Franco 2022)]